MFEDIRFVWVEAQIYQWNLPLLIVKHIFTFWIAGSSTSFLNILGKAHKKKGVRNLRYRDESVIFTVSNP